MGVSDWFRPRPAASSRPDDLLAALLDAFERKDAESAMHLINNNSDRIKTEFCSWMKPPASLREDAAAVGRYARTLWAIAQLFEKSGDASLRISMEGGLAEWNEALDRAPRLTASGKAGEAVTLLRHTLDDIATTSGPGTSHYRARCLGMLGLALDEMGSTSEAIRVTSEALDICRQSGDETGVNAYTLNLSTIGSLKFTDPATGHRLRVVIADRDGRTVLPEELPAAAKHSSPLKWRVVGGNPTHPEAERLHQEGRAAGEKGDFDAAIALFTHAAELDPSWPRPVYERAWTHLLKRDFDAARADYRKTLDLSPLGYFTAATAADLLSREAAGEFPAGLYSAFAMLEHMSPDDQRQIAGQLIEKFPSHAPAWELHAKLLEDPSDKLAAIESGLLARPDPDTRGSLLVQKALTLFASGEQERALIVLQPLTTAVSDSLTAHVTALLTEALIRSGGTNQRGAEAEHNG
jgi:tetratricopeptide (TPR) repeat protein